VKYLVQILLPLADNSGKPFPDELLRGIHTELAEKFGGLTAHSRAPAKGIWRSGAEKQTDDIVIVEVMADALDENWWAAFRVRLERLLKQEKLVVRAQAIQEL
jgi:hypothetical protein